MKCSKCDVPMVVRRGGAQRHLFLACSAYPACRETRSLKHPERNGCPGCGSFLDIVEEPAAGGWFLRCQKHPGCDGSLPLEFADGHAAGPAGTSRVPRAGAALNPTAEQIAITDLANSGEDVVVKALAGTGKTSTLVMFARASKGSVQYVAFNRAISADAEERFGDAARCSTFHSLAFRGLAKPGLAERVGLRPTVAELQSVVGVEDFDATVSGVRIEFSARQLTEFARLTVKDFVATPDRELSAGHVRLRTGYELDAATRAAVNEQVLEAARRLWTSYCRDGGLGYAGNHQIYAKQWQLLDPRIDADVILFDEAQDADPVMAAVMRAQEHAQVVYCGDDYQALYEWRGAVNALAQIRGATERWLTHSFRFGPAIAAEAQKILERLDCKQTIRGAGPSDSSVGEILRPDCIVCRTNRGAFDALSEAVTAGRRPHVVGTVAQALGGLVEGMASLEQGRTTDHLALATFRSWDDAVTWAEHSSQEFDPDAALIRLVSTLGTKRLRFLLGKTVDERSADLVITTVHQAKGREFGTVQLSGDFIHPDDMTPEQLRTTYVAVTRAKNRLDLGDGLYKSFRLNLSAKLAPPGDA